MECLLHFGITSMWDDTSALLSGRGEPHGGAKVLTLVAGKVYLKLHKRNKNASLSTSLGKEGGCSLDQVPLEKHGSDFFLLPPGVLVS